VILGRRATAPDGTAWRVGRRWLPERRPRFSRHGGEFFPNFGGMDVPADDLLGVIGVVLLMIAGLLFLFTVLIPLIALGVELIVLLALLAFGVTARLLHRRPWTVRARSASDGREVAFRAVGFRRSGRVRDELVRQIEAGATLAPAEALRGQLG
jgi:hypothetical protein